MDVTEYQKRINSITAQDSDSPTAGGDEWNLNLMYLNMAQQEWSDAYQWQTLFKEINTKSSTSTANATLSLPADFRKLSGFLTICDESNNAHEYALIDPATKSQYASTERFCYLLGYPGSYVLSINPGTHGSGASIFYSYWSSPASLCSPADVSMCPDPSYIVQRAIAYKWEANDDGRFVQAKAEAQKILSRMLEFEVSKGYSYDDRIKPYEETRYGFKIGRD